MTLHQTVVNTKKAGIGTGIGIGAVFCLWIFLKFVILMYQILFPPVVPGPNVLYGKLPEIQFPQNASTQNFFYTLETVSGSYPTFPDRLNVYQITQPQPGLNNLDVVTTDVTALGFTNTTGTVLPYIAQGGDNYQWNEPNENNDTTSIYRSITFDITSFNFTMTSNYLKSLVVLRAQNLSDQTSAINTVQTFLKNINLPSNSSALYSDIDLTKTESPDPDDDFNTSPQLYSISNLGQMAPTTSLSNAQVIRVDLYQSDIKYNLDAVLPGNRSLQSIPETIPIIYPNPPDSTMALWVASGDNMPEVVQANYTHQSINIPTDPTTIGVYPIITAQQAYKELTSGNAYIAAYNGTDTNILINKIYLAYYMGQTPQKYLIPVVVFEGNNGFYAFVPAVSSVETQQ